MSCNNEEYCNDANKVESADAEGCGLGHLSNGKGKGENGKRKTVNALAVRLRAAELLVNVALPRLIVAGRQVKRRFTARLMLQGSG